MAEELKTDEERAEELKRWWRENGVAVMAGIGLAFAIVFGWQMWQQHKVRSAEAGSAAFSAAQSSTENKVEKLTAVATEHSGTPYAGLAALTVAAESAQEKPETAINALRQALDNPDGNIVSIARLRLARILIAEGKLDDANSELNNSFPSAYDSLVNELKGDLFVARKELDKARSAYDEAIKKLDGAQAQYLQMKRDALGKGA